MTEEAQKFISCELDDALKSGDKWRVLTALVHAQTALIDCQRKTADRVKQLCIDADRTKARIDGARWAVRALAVLASAGGGAALIKILEAFAK